MERPSKDQYYINIAMAVSKRSTCLKRHYGAVIVVDDRIVGTGYNGSPSGHYNCCDLGICRRPTAEKGKDYFECPAVHAERNAIIQATKHDGCSVFGATLYLACEDVEHVDGVPAWDLIDAKPCMYCEEMIKMHGIARVVNGRNVLNGTDQ